MPVAPPSYDEATTAAAVNDYLSTRQRTSAPARPEQQRERAQNPLTCTIEPSASSSPPPFPAPANAWLARDVDHEDWSAFLAQLAVEEGDRKERKDGDEDEDKRREVAERQAKVVREWNQRFFAERGCRVEVTSHANMVDGNDAAHATGGQASKAGGGGGGGGAGEKQQNFEGLGFKLRDKFVGLAMPPNSNGAGIRLGGMLLGVASTKKQEDDKTAK